MFFTGQVTKTQRLVADGTQRRKSSFESTDEVDCCDYIRQILYHRGIPESASKFILNSWSQGTRKQYQSARNIWMVRNGFRFMDPLHTTEVVVLQFFNYLVHLNKSYSVINSHKAILLVTQPFFFFGNSWTKNCPLIVRFMKGVYFCLFVCLFYCFTSQVNSYGHCGTVSSLNHTFSWAGLNKRLTSNLCTSFRL